MKNFHRNEIFVLTVTKSKTQKLQKTPNTIDSPKIIPKAIEKSIKRSESLRSEKVRDCLNKSPFFTPLTNYNYV